MPLTFEGGAGSDDILEVPANDTISGDEGDRHDQRRATVTTPFTWSAGSTTTWRTGGSGNDLVTVTGTECDTFLVSTSNLAGGSARVEDDAGPAPGVRTRPAVVTGGNDQVTTSVDLEDVPSIPLELDGGPR